MPNPTLFDERISIFRSRIEARRFDDVTVGILESIIASREFESLTVVVLALKQFMREQSLLIFRKIEEESVEIKLLCADFLIHVFAVIGDVESCLALRYEALIMRDQKAIACPELQVSCKEWITFVQHSHENGFHYIANQACEKALVLANHVPEPRGNEFFHDVHAVERIKSLKEAALLASSSQSVPAQAIAYMKQKNVVQKTANLSASIKAQSSGCSMFKRGIRKHNLRRLHACQRLG